MRNTALNSVQYYMRYCFSFFHWVLLQEELDAQYAFKDHEEEERREIFAEHGKNGYLQVLRKEINLKQCLAMSAMVYFEMNNAN